MTREQFVERVSECIRTRFPLVKLARGDQPFSLRINEQVTPLENIYRITSLNPSDLQRQVERWVVEILRAGEGSPDQSASFDELRDRIYPMVLPTATSDLHTETMTTQPLVGDLVVAYAVDSDRTIAYIPGAHFQDWGITMDQLHEAAIANLVARSEDIQAHAGQDEDGSINLVIFQTLDGYDASRVLLPSLYDRLREHLGSPFAAAIPNRDILLCFRNDEETVKRVGRQVRQDFRQMPHQITDKLLLVTADGIAMR